MSAADELASAYVAWRDWQERLNARHGRDDDWRHEGKRSVSDLLDEQYERNQVIDRMTTAERAYRAEVGQVVR